ncbi:MAG TPA: citrate synthase family protein [Bradyrhizobium sp.]|jgi:citrate synthase|nr:citrate synthase family protein [Bradyrhizobium sp.]
MKKSAELYLSAREAAAELAISPATLYAYVSRGLIRSEPAPDSRSHRYRAEDVRGLKERRAPSTVEPRGFRSFDPDLPVMDSAIATITEEGAIYRGVNCVDLSEKDTLEHTATLLWDVTGVDPFAADNCPHVSDEMRAIAEAARRAAPIDRAIAVLALATSADPGAFTRAPEGRAMVGARIVRLLVATMLNAEPSSELLHQQIAKAWAPDNKHAPDLIRRALVLLADHELNASTFTVRCAASTGLNLYDSVIAGLAALKGPMHGGAGVLASRLVKTLIDQDAEPVIRERVALGERFAGFGHGVYKRGDPRAMSLLNALTRAGAARKFTREVPERIAEATGEFVNIDYALAVLAHSLRLAPGSELRLFAMARTVGWIAHASEQLQFGRLIRPRARYVGPAPGRGGSAQ